METLIHMLHLEDDPADSELVQATLAEAGLACRITRAQTRGEFETGLRDGGTDIILADYRLPTYDGMSALRLAHERYPEIPFIFVSGTMGEEAAIEALTQGATDYVLKQNLSRLAPAVQRALREALNRRERRQAREALQRSNEMLRAIVEAAPVAIIGLDLDGNVHSVWNPAAEEMLGWSAREVMGRPLPIVPPDRQEEFTPFREQIRRGMILDGVEVRRQRRDGTPIDYSIYASPLHDAQGRISGNIAVLVDITEKKRAEAALRASEARYIDLYDNAPDMYVSVHAQTASIVNCNQTLADTLGNPKAEIIGRPVFEIYHPDCLDQAKAAFQEFLESGEIHDRELQLRKKDGSKLEVSLNVSAVRAGDGAIVFSRSTLRDITERRRNSMINAARLRLMQFAVTHSLDELLEETVNEAEKLTESLIGFYHFVDDDQQSLTLQNWSTRTKTQFCKARGKGLHYPIADAGVWVDCARERKPVVHNDYNALTHRKGLPEGHAEVIRELVVPVMRGERVKAILGVGNKPADYSEKEVEAMSLMADLVWEIMERKQAETSIRKLSQAIEQSPVSIVITDVTGRIEFVNAKFTQITGYTFAEALGQNPRILKSGETPAEEYKRLWQTIGSGGVWQGEFHNRKKNDELFWEHATIAPVRDADNVITHYVAVKEDITERKKLEAQFRQAQKMEAVGQLAGGVAHDFNNMLGVIIGYAELALGKADLDDSLRKNLQGILAAGFRSSEITRQLLAFARKQTIAPKILDLNETVDGMLKLLRRLIGEDIDLAWLPGAKLWPIKMDPSQIDQILANLCVNARDAISGVGRISIETGMTTFDPGSCAHHPELVPGEYVLLAVSDDGCGMDHETLSRIFEPFFTTKEIGKSTGLGLATVYGIVKQNNGFINVYSEPGQGTAFKLYLPRHAAETVEAQRQDQAAPAPGGHETILLVEDEPSILDMAKLMLETFGYRVLSASTPGEAIRLANAHDGKIHLLIVDVIMPEMNGRDLAKQVGSLYPEMVCLFMSGYSGDVIAHHGMLDEGVNFIQKPFSMQNLAVKVREVLDAG
jgi:two-component system cell cycle sensor histidine kinase/response regulator CckA